MVNRHLQDFHFHLLLVEMVHSLHSEVHCLRSAALPASGWVAGLAAGVLAAAGRYLANMAQP